MVLFQSADGNLRLTVSVARDFASPGPTDGDTDLTNISEIRRRTEMELAAHVRLTPCQSTNRDGVWSSVWRGADLESGRQTATLVRLGKSKLLILYIEALDTSESAVDELAQQVFGSAAAK
jgi:hypothetical protein